jgi:beta-lactamase regulating signal transducer with metallopeptidase domain
VQAVSAIFAQMNGWIQLWFLGVLISIFKQGVDQLRINNFVKKSCVPAPPQIIALADEIRRHMVLSCRPRLLVARANQIPFCHGLLNPAVVIPEGESMTKYTVFLQHEFAHLVRRDLAALSLAQMTRTLCWFNPLVWFAVKMLRQESERAADDLVLSTGQLPEVYAKHIVELIESCQSEPAFQTLVLAMARPGMIRQRIQSILDGTVIRTPPSRRVVLGLGCAFFLLVSSSVCLRLAEADDIIHAGRVDNGSMKVHVVDAENQPITGAQVTPLVYLAEGGGSGNWYLPGKTENKESPVRFLTDQEGNASIPYVIRPDSMHMVAKLTVQVESPNYVPSNEIELDPVHPSDITLFPGETLKVQALGPKGEVLSHPLLLASRLVRTRDSLLRMRWHYSSDGTTLISNSVLPLNKNLDVIGIAEDGANHLLFSDMKTVVSYKPGGESTVTLEMKPGPEIRGQLDPTVPRPIKNGWVQYTVEQQADRMPSLQWSHSLDWNGFAPVAPDGSFVVNDVPDGIFEVIAMCDGYISKQQDAVVYPHPAAGPLVLSMEPTGTLQVKVQDQSGQPLPGAEVVSRTLYRIWDSTLDELKGEANLPVAKSSLPDIDKYRVVTDSRGLATFDNVSDTEVHYRVFKHGFNSSEYYETSVSGKSTFAEVTLTKVISK